MDTRKFRTQQVHSTIMGNSLSSLVIFCCPVLKPLGKVVSWMDLIREPSPFKASGNGACGESGLGRRALYVTTCGSHRPADSAQCDVDPAIFLRFAGQTGDPRELFRIGVFEGPAARGRFIRGPCLNASITPPPHYSPRRNSAHIAGWRIYNCQHPSPPDFRQFRRTLLLTCTMYYPKRAA